MLGQRPTTFEKGYAKRGNFPLSFSLKKFSSPSNLETSFANLGFQIAGQCMSACLFQKWK